MNEYSKLILSSTNKLLDYFSKFPEIPCGLPSNDQLARELNVSRTTVLKVVEVLCKKGVARKDGTNRILLRKPVAKDYFSSDELGNSKADQVEKQILKRLSTYELKPGDQFSELELSKTLNATTVTVREALIKIAQSGIIKKRPHQKWKVVEFSLAMVEEIMVIRRLYESYAIQAIQELPTKHSIWESFKQLKDVHQKLLKQSNIGLEEVLKAEHGFHITLIRACQNRFIEESYNSIFTLISFHLWQIEYDHPKIAKVVQQHLNILNAILAEDFAKAMTAMELHLEHAKHSMKAVNQQLGKRQIEQER